MAQASFAHLKREGSDLFIVKVAGRLGLRDRKTIEEFAQRCKDKGKDKVVFELSELEIMSGSVAATLGKFAAHQAERQRPVLFVGASDTVERFLQAQFKEVAPVFVEDLDAAEVVFSEDGGAARVRQPDAAEQAEEAKPKKAKPAPSDDSAENAVERTVEAIQKGSAPQAPRPSRRTFLSLGDAERIFANGGDLFGVKHALADLLHGADLADHCHLFSLSGKHLMEVEDPSLTFSAKGSLSERLRSGGTPVDMTELSEEDLSPAEADLLTTLNTQLVVPVLQSGELQAVFCVRKELPGHEYLPSDFLAMELLGRNLAAFLGGRTDTQPASASGDTFRVRKQLAQQRSASSLGKELTGIHDEDQLLNQLLVAMLSVMGVESAAYFQWKDGELLGRYRRGGQDESLPSLGKVNADAMESWNDPVSLGRADIKGLKSTVRKLGDAGFLCAIPLRVGNRVLGVLALGPKLNRGEEHDLDLLATLASPAAAALENARRVQKLHLQALGVAKKFVTLFEKRAGKVQATNTDRVVQYVVRVARAMNYPPEHIRDLLYGTVLRDIGMVEISDLVLRSPRSLTPEEWKLVQRHPVTGAETLENLDFHPTVLEIVRHHHERFNGEGYPQALQGADIPLGARIVSVAESFVAMTQDLPYRPALEAKESLDVLRENWGLRYDPSVVEAFLDIYQQDEDPKATPPDILELSISLGSL